MAPPSPRRSSRARAPNSQSQHSSNSSTTSGRVPRILNKTSSTKSTPSASLSSEPLDDASDTLLSRRRKRGQDDDQDKILRPDTSDVNIPSDDPQDEEDEAVRCLCESEDYPGCPPLDGPDADFFAAIEFTEDVTGFFVQCDVCKVWQHGACVGIFSAESSPDEYFCEQCRKDFHRIHTATNGQKYSKYVPLHRASRAQSRATSIAKDGAQSPQTGSKNLRPSSAHNSGKRRSTMNSRDAAYDDEQLLKAIEASKGETVETTDGSTRRTKRGRSDSEDNIPSVKRQRTSSQSESPPPERHNALSGEQSDDETQTRSTSKKARNARNHRERSEKEDKDRQRQEAANKRKGRAERRRAEDSDPSDDVPLAATKGKAKANDEPPSIAETPPAPQTVPDTPPTPLPPVASSHKRGARSHHKRGKGKNQYTKDREVDREESPARSVSRDIAKNREEPNGSNTARASTSDYKHKGKIATANKMSMLDMKRRVAAIMDFISRTQVDLAAEGNVGSNNNSPPAGAPPKNASSSKPNADSERPTNGKGFRSSSSAVPAANREFKDLSCIEMMDVLTRDMVKWQNQYT